MAKRIPRSPARPPRGEARTLSSLGGAPSNGAMAPQASGDDSVQRRRAYDGGAPSELARTRASREVRSACGWPPRQKPSPDHAGQTIGTMNQGPGPGLLALVPGQDALRPRPSTSRGGRRGPRCHRPRRGTGGRRARRPGVGRRLRLGGGEGIGNPRGARLIRGATAPNSVQIASSPLEAIRRPESSARTRASRAPFDRVCSQLVAKRDVAVGASPVAPFPRGSRSWWCAPVSGDVGQIS